MNIIPANEKAVVVHDASFGLDASIHFHTVFQLLKTVSVGGEILKFTVPTNKYTPHGAIMCWYAEGTTSNFKPLGISSKTLGDGTTECTIYNSGTYQLNVLNVDHVIEGFMTLL